MNTIWHCSDFDQFYNFLSDVPGSKAWEVNEHTEALTAQTLYYQSKISHNLLHFQMKQHLHVIFMLSQCQYLLVVHIALNLAISCRVCRSEPLLVFKFKLTELFTAAWVVIVSFSHCYFHFPRVTVTYLVLMVSD